MCSTLRSLHNCRSNANPFRTVVSRMRQQWKRAIIVGASSGIGEAIACELARMGVATAIIGRRSDRLQRVAETASTLGAPCIPYVHDVTHFDEVPELFQRITHDLRGLDIIIYSAGIMPKVAPDEYSFAKDKAIIEVNTLGAMAWLNEAAKRFRNTGSGTIVGISSIAGERGRRAIPAYYTSKAGLSTYLESLRNRLSQYGVRVTTIKPGFVQTAMLDGLTPPLGAVSAEEAARQTLSAARKGAVVKYVGPKWRLISMIVHLLPSFIFRRLNF